MKRCRMPDISGVKYHVYVKRQRRIWTTWLSCRLQFVISKPKLAVSRNFLSIKNCLEPHVFICSLSILRNSQLESDVCRLPDTWIRMWISFSFFMALENNVLISFSCGNVVVQFYPWFKFSFLLCLGMIVYDDDHDVIMSLKQKKTKFEPRIKLDPKRNHNFQLISMSFSGILPVADFANWKPPSSWNVLVGL